ncbi:MULTISPECIES: hypothetical protein [Streptosporangium]|uniref:Secreted protein n=1 Tax=Streptosporangium brasiliense TaxID=47480 RepID=A0ABT9QW93_9ACTN|nr:hypothetical protein [Streptosporangium brasiliense]MDP9861152.1 hypothetical protein [Streptosporangium brasiliense]
MNQIVNRGLALVMAGAAIAGGLAMSTPASAATLTTTTTCSTSGPIQGLNVKACVDVTGGQVRVYGIIGALGISEPPVNPRSVGALVSGAIVGGAPLGSGSQALSIWNNTFTVEGVTTTVASGTTVRAKVEITPGPVGPGGGGTPLPGPTSVSVDVPVIY